jgi:hypothetical protein
MLHFGIMMMIIMFMLEVEVGFFEYQACSTADID